MSTRLVHVGFGHYITTETIVAIATPQSSPVKRDIQDARDKGQIIDLTNGRRTKAVVYTDARYIVLTALEPATINGRLETGQGD